MCFLVKMMYMGPAPTGSALVGLAGSGSALLNHIPDNSDVDGAWATLQGRHNEGYRGCGCWKTKKNQYMNGY